MKSVDPREPVAGFVRVRVAEDQPQYIPLTANINFDLDYCPMETEWELTAEELAGINAGGKIRLTILTFHRSIQPVLLEVTNCEYPDSE